MPVGSNKYYIHYYIVKRTGGSETDRLKRGSRMSNQGANKRQSCTAVELTEGLSEINSLHNFLHLCLFIRQMAQEQIKMCVT